MKDEKKIFSNQYKKYIFMLKYYEHVILRPTYKIYNLFMIAHQIVVGKECLIYQGLAFEFIKLTAKLYITIDKMTRSCRDDEIDKEKKYYMQCFEKPIILRFENISIKKDLLSKNIEEILEDAKYIFKHKLKTLAK